MGNNRNSGGGRDSKSFKGGSNHHFGASRSQSGQQSRGYQQPKPQRGNRGPSIGEQLAGYRYPKPFGGSSGGSSGGKKRKKR